jgi:hypothetical protein
MASTRKDAFNLCNNISDQLSKAKAPPRRGIFKVIAIKTVSFTQPTPGCLIIGTLHPEGSDTLVKLMAYENSCSCFAELLKLKRDNAIELTDYQEVSPFKIQLLRRAKILMLDAKLYVFPRLHQTTVETYIMERSENIVLSEPVKFKEFALYSPVTICCNCRCRADPDLDACAICGCEAVCVTISAVLRAESADRVSIRAFMETESMLRLLNVDIGQEFTDLLLADPKLAVLDKYVKAADDWYLVISQRYFKQDARAPSDNEVKYVVESILTSREYEEALQRSRTQSKRRR